MVSDYKQAVDLLEEGIANRITAATHIHDASSRSHAIFTIQYTQVRSQPGVDPIPALRFTRPGHDPANPSVTVVIPVCLFVPVQAILENNLPSEIVSKIHLVDLAGR